MIECVKCGCNSAEWEEGFCTIRTSGKAKIYCRTCGRRMTEKLKKNGTPYIVTPYESVHAQNAKGEAD